MLKFRASNLHNLISASGKITQGVQSALLDVFKKEQFGYSNFTGSKETEKGIMLEPDAILASGEIRDAFFVKHEGRLTNDFITGECDILDRANNRIIDVKCSWSIGTHPFLQRDAEAKAHKAGYDIQMQAYMWLYDCAVAEVDFWLLPTPNELLSTWDSMEQHITLVDQIPLHKRVTTVRYERDGAMIQKIIDFMPKLHAEYAAIEAEFNSK